MTQITDRDPADQAAMKQAARIWYAAQDDEADIAFEAALIGQGVISPADVVMSLSPIHDAGLIRVVLVDGTTIHIDSYDGTVA